MCLLFKCVRFLGQRARFIAILGIKRVNATYPMKNITDKTKYSDIFLVELAGSISENVSLETQLKKI